MQISRDLVICFARSWTCLIVLVLDYVDEKKIARNGLLDAEISASKDRVREQIWVKASSNFLYNNSEEASSQNICPDAFLLRFATAFFVSFEKKNKLNISELF